MTNRVAFSGFYVGGAVVNGLVIVFGITPAFVCWGTTIDLLHLLSMVCCACCSRGLECIKQLNGM
jgi:hypothetical protein